jgi:hypothetical protein
MTHNLDAPRGSLIPHRMNNPGQRVWLRIFAFFTVSGGQFLGLPS